MNKLLFDSFALLRFFHREPGAEKVRGLLAESLESAQERLISAINVGELIYIVQRRFGEQEKLQMLVHLQALEFTILPCPNDLIFRAAELKARYAVSYADAFALASAIEQGADLVTGDPEFKQVEHLVKIIWV
ncbi:MAG: type II toxin-antitoxin system VapC family toxin [Geobacter sp.]|nr:type II toxin-antitoxin system VapC family toxin [Geobacter sp.]